jgi:putative transposase
MPNYRRMRRQGGTFFLTLVTEHRAPLFRAESARALLRRAIENCRRLYPFPVDAIVLLPEHLHLLMTLPPDDTNYPLRLSLIKAGFTRAYLAAGGTEQARSASRQRQRTRGVWLKRYWEHTIREQEDPNRHYDYICYNPVKHKHATCPHAWPHSSFHRLVAEERYRAEWCCQCEGEAFEEPPEFQAIARLAGE